MGLGVKVTFPKGAQAALTQPGPPERAWFLRADTLGRNYWSRQSAGRVGGAGPGAGAGREGALCRERGAVFVCFRCWSS